MTLRFEIQIASDPVAWEAFQLLQPMPQFMQSWQAGVLAQTLGESPVRFAMYDQGNLVSTMAGSIISAKRGKYLLISYGPTTILPINVILPEWTDYLRRWGREQGLDFIRCCPFFKRDDQTQALFHKMGWKTSPIHTLAEDLWLLDIRPSENDLLMHMSKTTRNLVRRAIKDGVEVTTSTDDQDVEAFLSLHAATKDRHKFTPYPDTLFYEQVRAFKGTNQVLVLKASHQGTLIASAIVMYYGAMASYHHGASIPSKIPAAYALQWEAIKEGKRRGCTTYNFWGVTDLSDTKHPFYGISLFKTRFGGYGFELQRSQDLPLTSRYTLISVLETIRRLRRGFGLKRS